ncbi:hypothetical protein L208DRAFT_1396417 [Tricholoma matsutake]|nr:hypothetical protein L208DRAFT_1396415 [Tricholoma matsutake 945]KAF8232967.1 hypothetical protein L208DRAFT_1396417 [Tricholoma matsutake 945]
MSSGAATMEEGRHGSWAAGGIGITPFLATLNGSTVRKSRYWNFRTSGDVRTVRPSDRAAHGLLTARHDGSTGYSMLQGQYLYALPHFSTVSIIEIPIVITEVNSKHWAADNAWN